VKGILDFFDIMPSSGFDVPAQEAIDRFQAKGLKTSFAWQDVMRDEHKSAFTVAKMMDMDMLADVKESLDDALANGVVFRDWADNLIPMLQQKGWWGRQAMLDPLTGETIIAQLGSPGRLKTIFRTNMASAYAAGHWDQIEAQAEDAPYLLYDAIDDYRTRPAHKAWDGKVLPITDTFWKFHTPPCGYNCRCSVIQLDDSDLEQLGVAPGKSPQTSYYDWTNPRTGKTIKVPNGVDPGFGHAASSRIDDLRKLATEKAKALPTEPMVSAATKALAEMDKALADKTPYLSTAIKSLQAKSPELGPVQMLAEAQAKAAKAKQSAWLSEYKNSLQAGKNPSASAQKAFDSLPQEAQLALLKDIEQKNALLKANADATAKLDEFKSATPTSAQGKALAAMQKAGELDGLSVIEQAAKLEAKVIEVKQQANTASMISGYKAKIVAGKIPTEAQVNAFKSLPEADQQSILSDIDKKKTKINAEKPAPASPAPTQDAIAPEPVQAPAAVDNFVQIGPQKGSNPGGLFQDTETGEKWYVKFPDNIEAASNEALTAKLYELTGIDVPDYRFVTVDGKKGIASRFIEGLESNKAKLVAKTPGVAEGFAVDAWLANWDVVGLNFDNMLLKGAKAYRVDTGGGLLYRAQGGSKGSAWGNTVTELDTLRDPRTNAQAAKVFGKLTDQQIEESVRRVLLVKDTDIEKLVEQFGPRSVADRVKLAETLIARKQDLWERYPKARPDADIKPAPVADSNKQVTNIEQKTIIDSRSNGYAIRTDSGDIEDHNVTVSTFKTPGGGTLTRTQLKLTEQGGAKLEQIIAQNSHGEPLVVADPTSLNSEIVQLLKGINSRAAKGGAIDQVNVDRWASLKDKMEEKLQELVRASAIKGVDDAHIVAVENYLSDWYGKLAQAMEGKSASSQAIKIDGMFQTDKLQPIVRSPLPLETNDGIQWQKSTKWRNRTASVNRGYATLTNGTYDVPGVDTVFITEIDGAKVTYVPFKGNSSGRSFQGTLTIEKNGTSTVITGDTLSALEKLGIKAHRSTDADRLELYLNKHARLYTVSNSNYKSDFEALSGIADQEQRIAKKLELVNKMAGADISKSPYYGTYDGKYQAFGHGRAQQLRADLNEADFKKFASKYTVYNNPTGLGTDAHDTLMLRNLKSIVESGGMYVSRTDMVRRGLPMQSGTSVSADIGTGGGSYIFTRIMGNSRTKGGGLYWKPSVLRRVDAISYNGDEFGNTTDRYLANRNIDPSGWANAARSSRNETIFKDGLSIFDELDTVLFTYQKQAEDMIQFMRDHGYSTWPDGRKLEDVIRYKGQA